MSSVYKDGHLPNCSTAKPLTLDKRLAIISRHVAPGGRFLDCGCGKGQYVRPICLRLGLDAFGVEYEQESVDNVQSDEFLSKRISQGDLQNLDYPDGEWDYALLNEVLEHVGDDEKVLCEVHRVLKPGGLLFVFSPNRWFPFETHGVTLKMNGRLIYWLPFVPYVPAKLGQYLYRADARNYWQGQLRRMLERAGFTIVERTFIWPTFEGISGKLPRVLKPFRHVFRYAGIALEKTIFLKRFGVSQVFVCRKGDESAPPGHARDAVGISNIR
ncbi:MAG TPA: class I SAM-dependent methyltransferase [Verrucomicrobiae bacterium]|nr:class I SAM-dependent methyltransferase [Verrucomicrobiae bacterium]